MNCNAGKLIPHPVAKWGGEADRKDKVSSKDFMSEQLDQMRLPIDNLVDVVISEPLYHTDKVFDYLWGLIPSEVSIYKLVSKCFFFNRIMWLQN